MVIVRHFSVHSSQSHKEEIVMAGEKMLELLRMVSRKRDVRQINPVVRIARPYNGVLEARGEDLADVFSRKKILRNTDFPQHEPIEPFDGFESFGMIASGQTSFGHKGHKPSPTRQSTSVVRRGMSKPKKFGILCQLADGMRKPRQTLRLVVLIAPAAPLFGQTKDGTRVFIYNKLDSDEKARLIRGPRKPDTS